MGIGKSISIELAKRGYDLILTSRNEQLLEEVRNDCKSVAEVDVHVVAVDLSQSGGAEFLFQWTRKNNLEVSLLVNNAGFGDYGSFYTSSYEKISDMIQVNVTSLTQLTRLFLPTMIQKSHGYIMNVASVAGFIAGPYMAVYYATKAFVISFTEAIAEELKGTGVVVSALCSGATETSFFERAAAGSNPLFKRIPMPSASAVASFGVKALFKKKIVAIHGAINQLNVFMLTWLPRRFVIKLLARFQQTR